MTSRVPPQALDAEQSILGSLMLDQEAWEEVEDILSPDDFYKTNHRKIFDAMKMLFVQNLPIDLITVSNYLREKTELDLIGGSDYLIEILNSTISSANLSSYIRIVKEKSTLRKIINASSNIIERAYQQDFSDISSFVDSAESEMFGIGDRHKISGLTGSMEIVKNTYKKIEELSQKGSDITGVSSGFRELDRMTAGLNSGEMIIVAARPSMGKTAFSLNLALNAAVKGNKVAFFSQEMSKEQLMMRLIAQKSETPLSDLRIGRIPNENWSKIINAASALSETSLFIDDTTALSPFEVRAKCRRQKRQHGLDLVIIDYLQLMRLKQKTENREREVSEISARLKHLSQELQIPVIALAQLNRGVEGRSNRRPMLSDLRESGSLEQDADLILMLYRDEYYDKDDPEKTGNAEVIIAKHRNGPTGTVELRFEANHCSFRDPANTQLRKPPQPPPPSPTQPRNLSVLKNFAPSIPS